MRTISWQWEKNYFLSSNLLCLFSSVKSCPLVLLPVLILKNILGSIFSWPFNILKTLVPELWIMLRFTFGVFFFQILTIAVLVILLTAPIGAVAITLSGPKLLTRSARCISDVNISVSSASVAMTKPSEAEKMVWNCVDFDISIIVIRLETVFAF